MMKKRYAVMMTAAMLSGIMTATALAEGPGMGSGMQISGPQMPGSGEMGQAPQMNGMGPNDNFGFIAFETFVEDGTISQETYEAITKFMEENKPELPESMNEGERPELPEGVTAGERPEMTEGEGPDLLKDLLEGGVISQEEYDALAAARAASRPAAPAESQSASGTQTQTADETTGA